QCRSDIAKYHHPTNAIKDRFWWIYRNRHALFSKQAYPSRGPLTLQVDTANNATIGRLYQDRNMLWETKMIQNSAHNHANVNEAKGLWDVLRANLSKIKDVQKVYRKKMKIELDNMVLVNALTQKIPKNEELKMYRTK